MFENAIQSCADLAQHIATRDFDFKGNTTKGAVRALGRGEVTDEQTMQTLTAAIGFRNVLAHEYGHIQYTGMYETLQFELAVHGAFSQQVATWFRQNH